MIEENKFFRFLWRFNALAIALAVLAVLGSLGYGFVLMLTHDYWEKPQGHFAPAPKGAEAKNTYRLRTSGAIAFKNGGGEDVYLVYSLGAWNGAPNVYSLASVSGVERAREPANANLLLMNAHTGAGKWLFNGLGRNIRSWEKVVDSAIAGNAVAEGFRNPGVQSSDELFGGAQYVKAVVLKVVERDTNHDNELTDDDGVSLYVWQGGNDAPVKILEATLVLDQAQIGAARYTISYELGDQAWLAIYSVPDFKLLSKTKLPKVPG